MQARAVVQLVEHDDPEGEDLIDDDQMHRMGVRQHSRVQGSHRHARDTLRYACNPQR